MARIRVQAAALLFGLVGSIVGGYFAFRDVDAGAFADAVRGASYWWIPPALLLLAGAVAVRVARWRMLFPEATRPPATAATRAFLVGELFNSVLPLRAGEVARVVALHRTARTSRSEAAATAIVERTLDVLVLLLLLFAALLFVPDLPWVGAAVLLFAAAAAGLLVAVLGLRRYASRPILFLVRPVGWLSGGAARRDLAAASVFRGLRGFREASAAALAAVLTALSWLLVALSFWVAMRGMGLALGYPAAVLVTAATTFSLVIPALPTSVGVFEAATLVTLEPYDVPESQALSYAVVLHVFAYAPFIAAGTAALVWPRRSWRQERRGPRRPRRKSRQPA